MAYPARFLSYPLWHRVALVLGFFALYSCGGGASPADATPPSPTVVPTPTTIFTPSPVAAPQVPSGDRLVTDFGAKPDDGVDDTAAIQAALDAVNTSGGGTLVFPPGQYDVRINPAMRRALTLHPRIRMLGRPAGQATIRLADNQPIYETIMATASFPTRLDDAVFEGLVFDANGLNNPVRNPDETNGDLELRGITSFRYVLRTFAGSRVRVTKCTFTNNDNGNILSFNGDAISDIVVDSNRFVNVGGALIDHDHSSIYAYGPRIRIANNEFRSRFGAGTLGARTAIETHTDDQEVVGNTVHGYLQGANAVSRVGAPVRQLYRDNTFTAMAVGINIWPVAPTLFAGPAFTALVIQNNTITLDTDTWWRSPAMVVNAPAGIHFEAQLANARITQLHIVDNRITFDSYAGRIPDADRFSAGVELRGVEGRLAIDVLNLSRNTVTNSIGPGILSLALVGSGDASVMADNRLVDTGRGPNLVGAGDVLRSGMVVGGTSRNLSLARNSISTRTGTPTLTLNGVVVDSACSENCSVSATRSTGLRTPVIVGGSGWVNKTP
jgi:Pectate lyase superfamily protein